jgi:hypothetical protein
MLPWKFVRKSSINNGCQVDWILQPMVQWLLGIRSPARQSHRQRPLRRDSCRWCLDSCSGWSSDARNHIAVDKSGQKNKSDHRTELSRWKPIRTPVTAASRPYAAWLRLSTASPWLPIAVPSSPVSSPRPWTCTHARQCLLLHLRPPAQSAQIARHRYRPL